MSKPGASSRKEFVRTKIPRGERFVAAAILLILGVIAAAVLWKGKHFNPDIFLVRTESLDSTKEPVIGKSATARGFGGGDSGGEGYPVEGEGQNSSSTTKPSEKGEALEIAIEGLKPMSPTEFYNPDNLYEKINGRAPAYQGFNVQQLRCRSFSVVAAAGSFVDVYEYQFDTPANAFGMLGLERDPKGGAIDFAPDGYSGGLGFFFRQGKCYVQVIGSDQKPETAKLTEAVARHRAQNLPADDAGLAARRRLPAAGLDFASIQYVRENALGQDFLKDVFHAEYSFKGGKLTFFIMADTPEAVAASWEKFREFSGKYGGKVTAMPDSGGAKIFSAENFGTFRVIYQRGGELGGVFDAGDVDKARQFIEEYLQGRLK